MLRKKVHHGASVGRLYKPRDLPTTLLIRGMGFFSTPSLAGPKGLQAGRDGVEDVTGDLIPLSS